MNPQYEAHERLCKSIGDMVKQNEALKQRIQRLEKAGEDLAVCGYFMGFEDELKAWRKAVKDSQ